MTERCSINKTLGMRSPESTTPVDSNPYKSPIEDRSSRRDDQVSHAGEHPPGFDGTGSPLQGPWYLRYPISSSLALFLATAVTAASAVLFVTLAESSLAGQMAHTIIAFLDCVAVIVVLLAIMWFFQTGGVSTLMISFVVFCHLGVIATGLLLWFDGGKREVTTALVLGIPLSAFPVSILFGLVNGVLRKRAF